MEFAMWNGHPIELQDWSEFADELPQALASIGHTGLVAVRNFELDTADIDEDGNPLRDVDRLEVVRETGTDRDDRSLVWNAEGHDYDHDAQESGKSPSQIIYAFVADVGASGYVVHHLHEPEEIDVTVGLCDRSGILIYNASRLMRVAKNEHWFIGDPREALLLVFTLAPEDEDID